MPGAALATPRTCSGVRSIARTSAHLMHSSVCTLPCKENVVNFTRGVRARIRVRVYGTATLRMQVPAKRRDLVNSTEIGQLSAVRNGQPKSRRQACATYAFVEMRSHREFTLGTSSLRLLSSSRLLDSASAGVAPASHGSVATDQPIAPLRAALCTRANSTTRAEWRETIDIMQARAQPYWQQLAESTMVVVQLHEDIVSINA